MKTKKKGEKMPLFDYECPACQHEFEGLYKFEDDVPCEKCGAQTKKLPTKAHFQISGYRAANGYGGKFIDTPGRNPVTAERNGYSHKGADVAPLDHNQGKDGRA
jgi:putative FmdB family regulatory protein